MIKKAQDCFERDVLLNIKNNVYFKYQPATKNYLG